LRIADDINAILIQTLDGVERILLHFRIDAGRVGKIKDRLAAATKRDALINCGQEAAAEIGVAAARTFLAGVEDNKTRQVARLATQSISNPGAEAGPAKLLRAGVHENLPRRVIERVRDHRLDNGDVVDDL